MRHRSNFVQGVRFFSGWLLLLLSLAATAAYSQSEKPAPAAAPGLDLIVGKWTVTGQMGDPASPSSMTNEESCDWASGHSAVVCDIDTSGPFGHSHGMSVHTFDPNSSQYTYHSLNSSGSSETANGTSSGPDDIMWTGKLSTHGHEITTRLSIHRTAPNEETVKLERGTGDGSFVLMMQGKRVRKP